MWYDRLLQLINGVELSDVVDLLVHGPQMVLSTAFNIRAVVVTCPAQ